MGTLYVVSTPIGNLEDISFRALRILLSVSYIACEDTRRTGMLLSELKKRHESDIETTNSPKLISYYDQVEKSRTPEILELLKHSDVALVSDAGTPLICDPGYILVHEARNRNVPVIAIPGPTAAITALSISGLPVNSFMFFGYPPEKQSTRLKFLADLLSRHGNNTYVFYCSPHKFLTTLEDMKVTFGDIEIVICRELTKIHEEISTQKLSSLLNTSYDPKGEYVVLFRLGEKNREQEIRK